MVLCCLPGFEALADAPRPAGNFYDPGALKQLSLEELSHIEIATLSRERAFESPSAVAVIAVIPARLWPSAAVDTLN